MSLTITHEVFHKTNLSLSCRFIKVSTLCLMSFTTNLMKITLKTWKTRKSMKKHENQWKSMKKHENQQKSRFPGTTASEKSKKFCTATPKTVKKQRFLDSPRVRVTFFRPGGRKKSVKISEKSLWEGATGGGYWYILIYIYIYTAIHVYLKKLPWASAC